MIRALFALLLCLPALPGLAQPATLLRDEIARVEPFSDAAAAASLRAGARVSVIERRGAWVRLERPAGWLRGVFLRAAGASGPSPEGSIAALPSGRDGGGTVSGFVIRGRPPATSASVLADAVFAQRAVDRRVTLERDGTELVLGSSHAGLPYLLVIEGARLWWLHPGIESDPAPLLPGRSLRIAAPAAGLPVLAMVSDTAIDELLPDKRLENDRVVIEPSEAGLPDLVRALTLGRFGCEGAACPVSRYGAARLP